MNTAEKLCVASDLFRQLIENPHGVVPETDNDVIADRIAVFIHRNDNISCVVKKEIIVKAMEYAVMKDRPGYKP